MADNKKYYYIRLKENFFDTNEIVLLESMQDGYLYSNILLKLYLRSLKDDGRLMFNNRIPYNPQMIAAITRHQVGTVEKALQIFQEIGLIEVLDNGAIYMLDIQKYIGQSSTEADRQRVYYNKIKQEQKPCKISCKKSTPEIELELRDIDRDKDIDNKEKNSIKKESAGAHNKKFVKPTVEEVRAYCQERNNTVDANRFVDYYEANGWKVGRNSMKDWKAAVRTWERREVGGLQSRNLENSTPGSDFEDAIF